MSIIFQCHAFGPLQNNTYILTDEASRDTVIIDPAIGSQSLIDDLYNNNLNLTQIWVTHAHFDHAAGVSQLLKRIEKSVRVGMHPLEIPLWKSGGGAQEFGFEMNFGPLPELHLIHQQILEIGNISIQVMHTPGHTPGHVIFYCADISVAFVGDLIFYHSVGRSDFMGGDQEALLTSIREQILTLPQQTRLLSGHGIETTVAEEIKNNPFLN